MKPKEMNTTIPCPGCGQPIGFGQGFIDVNIESRGSVKVPGLLMPRWLIAPIRFSRDYDPMPPCDNPACKWSGKVK